MLPLVFYQVMAIHSYAGPEGHKTPLRAAPASDSTRPLLGCSVQAQGFLERRCNCDAHPGGDAAMQMGGGWSHFLGAGRVTCLMSYPQKARSCIRTSDINCAWMKADTRRLIYSSCIAVDCLLFYYPPHWIDLVLNYYTDNLPLLLM